MEDGEAKRYPHNITLLGSSSTLLLESAVSMYWTSLRLEIATMIFALHSILSNKNHIPELNENDPAYLSDNQRLSIRIIPYLRDWWPFPELPESDDFEVDLAKEALFGANGMGGARAHQNKPIEYRLARAILISAGLLDIAKIVEYRTPQFPSQCGDPQLGVFENRVVHLKKGRMDVQFISLTCNDCDKVFRAPYYECTLGCRHKDFSETGEVFAVCALCFQTTPHEQTHLRRKRLESDIPEIVAKELCECPEVDNPLVVSLDFEGTQGKDIDAWFEEREKNGLTLEGHVRTCQYLAMQAKRRACVLRINELEDKAQAKKLGKDDGKYEPRFGDRILKMLPNRMREKHFPMGNVHAAIMFGPLLIENGVARTKHGVTISPREPPNLGATYSNVPNLAQCVRNTIDGILIVSGDKKRELYSAQHPELRKRKLNASVVQVMGGLFSTHEGSWQVNEEPVIAHMLQAAKAYKPQLMLQQKQAQAERLLQAADDIVAMLQATIGSEVRCFLHLLLRQMPDRHFPLEWNMPSNNCQVFCDNLLRDFDTVFPVHGNRSSDSSAIPNYLLSFTARFPALSQESFVTSSLDAYFRSFHQELDVIDTLEAESNYPPSAEGAFTPNNCDRLLLWDCLGENCHLADHMWRHASDSISILRFHLQRPPNAYWKDVDGSGRPQRLSREEWLRQRVQVMLGIDIFHGLAAGIVQTYRRREGWLMKEEGAFMDEEEFEAEGRLPYASIEVINGNSYIDPETGQERPLTVDGEIFGEDDDDFEDEFKPMYGKWSPGSSDTVGRKGPQWMADTEGGERLVLAFYEKTWRRDIRKK